jgi:two-component system, cell cycle sensor histidine kinase and response regulator CckA
MGKRTLMAKSTDKSTTGRPELTGDARTNLLLAQKTEVISDLAGAMANQFNNIMMAVSSYAELELKKASSQEKRSLEQVLSNAARATSLMQKLLAFSRKQVPSPQPLQLNRVLTEISNLLQLVVGEGIEVVLAIDPTVQNVKVDRVELEQLILSLAIDGRNAMTRGGKLTVSTEIAKLNSKFIGTEDAEPGQFVVLSVADSGTVIDQRKDSSKPDRRSSPDLRIGLALAAASGIAKEARGLVRVSSEPESGTSFKIYFPALEQDAPEAKDGRESLKILPVARTVLVVEDDDSVRIPTTEFLKMEGFKVLQARTGSEALHVVERNRSPLDLLITDIVMPGMGGPEVAAKLIEMHPDLKVLYMSGDVDKAASWSDSAKSRHAVLQKPFRLNMLNDKIHDLLGQ